MLQRPGERDYALSMDVPVFTDSPFVYLTFLAAPAILTNASTVLALGTSNRLARASDRARSAAASIVGAKDPTDPLVRLQQADFDTSTRRAGLLVTALRRFYLAAACFSGGTCVALVGAFANYMGLHWMDNVTQILTVVVAAAGVSALVAGSITVLRETGLALRALENQHAAITTWRATHIMSGLPPGV